MPYGMYEYRNYLPRANEGAALNSQASDALTEVNRLCAETGQTHNWTVTYPDGTKEDIQAQICAPQNKDGSLLLQNYQTNGTKSVVAQFSVYEWESVTWGKDKAGIGNNYLIELLKFLRERAEEEVEETTRPEIKRIQLTENLSIAAQVDPHTDNVRIDVIKNHNLGATFVVAENSLMPLDSKHNYPTFCSLPRRSSAQGTT